jgi:NADPH:quinone reductase
MLKQHGGFAEYAIHDALTTIVLGKELPMDPIILAASPCAAWTAYRALYDKFHLHPIPKESTPENPPNDPRSLCIIGASGGVGSFALQFAKLSGLQTIIAVCSGIHADYVHSLGATHVIDYHQEPSLHEALQRITDDQGVELILDCVGSATVKDAIRSLQYDGMICPIVSFAEGDLFNFLSSHTFCQVSLGAAHGRGLGPRQRLKACGERVTELLLQNRLQVPVTKVISLEEIPDTLKAMLAANNTGKIVLKL